MCFLPHRVFLAAPPQWPPSARCSSVPWWPPTRPVPPADVDSLGFVPGKWWKNDGTCRDSCGFSRILASWGVIYIYRIWTSEYWEVHHQNSGRCQDSVGFELQNIWVEGTDNLIMRWSIPLAKHLEILMFLKTPFLQGMRVWVKSFEHCPIHPTCHPQTIAGWFTVGFPY